jgi:hypothetical protein
LDDAVFSTIGVTVDATEFVATADPLSFSGDGDDFLLYDNSGGGTGNIYYDSDGTAGGTTPVLFATLTGTPAIAFDDFTVI